MIYTHGLNIVRQEEDDDYGLPRTLTIDTLENEQYLCVPLLFLAVSRVLMMVAYPQVVRGWLHHGVWDYPSVG